MFVLEILTWFRMQYYNILTWHVMIHRLVQLSAITNKLISLLSVFLIKTSERLYTFRSDMLYESSRRYLHHYGNAVVFHV